MVLFGMVNLSGYLSREEHLLNHDKKADSSRKPLKKTMLDRSLCLIFEEVRTEQLQQIIRASFLRTHALIQTEKCYRFSSHFIEKNIA